MTESGERAAAIVKAANKIYDAQCDRGRSYDNALNYEQICEVIAAVEQAAFEAGRGQELERCAKQLCEYCRDGVPFVDVDPAMAVNRGSFWHRNPIDPMVMSKCGAEAIRALPAPPDSGDAL